MFTSNLHATEITTSDAEEALEQMWQNGEFDS